MIHEILIGLFVCSLLFWIAKLQTDINIINHKLKKNIQAIFYLIGERNDISI
jgi:hypothetical protein